MSDRLKTKIGETLYNQVIAAGIKPTEIDLVDGWIPKTRLDETLAKLKATSEKITSYEKQIKETTEMVKGSDELKKQFDDLQTKYTSELSVKDKMILNISKSTKVREALILEGAQHVDLLMSTINLDNVVMVDNNIAGVSDIISNTKGLYGDLFKTKENAPGGVTVTPGQTPKPDGTVGLDSMSMDDYIRARTPKK